MGNFGSDVAGGGGASLESHGPELLDKRRAVAPQAVRLVGSYADVAWE